ncbi:MAG: hypothetical protein M1819_003722 [Sarea resinae]|nr:MAG: hypothetical protein M1819_003722 [Sarea resinae]
MAASSLAGCVASLRTSNQLLDSSISILDSGVSDFPRLTKVLTTTRHFELVSEPTLQQAQSSLLSEITPEVTHLLSRVSTHLDKLERREHALMAKCELQEGRISQHSSQQQSMTRNRGKSIGGGRNTIGGAAAGAGLKSGAGEMEALRLRQLRQKKERLSYAVERLTLQAQQRERQLRMSMAAQ